MKILVLGGSGFIGRSVVEVLIERGHEVVIGTRKPLPSRFISSAYVVKQIQLHRLTRATDWLDHINPFDIIINCVGILRERWGETFESVYQQAPTAMAQACATLKKRFIHITALGLTEQASSGFITAKLAGERQIEQIGGQACIVRPALLDGIDGFGSRWLRRVAQWPVHFIPKDAVGRLAPLSVRDLGEAIAALCFCPQEQLPTSVELGGEKHYSMAQYLNALRAKQSPAITVGVPAWIVRAFAHMLDILHFTPLSWGHVELMRRDNTPRQEDALALQEWIGRAPIRIEAQPEPLHIANPLQR